jgi:hypothetical protein
MDSGSHAVTRTHEDASLTCSSAAKTSPSLKPDDLYIYEGLCEIVTVTYGGREVVLETKMMVFGKCRAFQLTSSPVHVRNSTSSIILNEFCTRYILLL